MKILVIEDEQDCCDLLKDQFSKIHSVTIFSNSKKAFDHYKSNQDYDVIITDYLMPKLNGLELIKKVLRLNRKQHFIMTSGDFSENFMDSFGKLSIHIPVIKKPYDLDHLSILLEIIPAGIE
ncbi:MAG: hypothetical protein COA79_15970 [Planctomycetota bacterium]|nr:MAG: hypothetical protein COA79_15970 [Planctomycetota bacterium]